MQLAVIPHATLLQGYIGPYIVFEARYLGYQCWSLSRTWHTQDGPSETFHREEICKLKCQDPYRIGHYLMHKLECTGVKELL